ncbi:MAG: alanine racemase [Ilumatobacteraceae bacterium]
MTLRLTVDTRAWEHHVAGYVDAVGRLAPSVRLVPVVKGNGYGFGRPELAARAAAFADTIAVGTVHELDAVPDGVDVVVLTPTLAPPTGRSPARATVLTVGAPEHVEALAGWSGRVVVKVASSMQRYGRGAELADTARQAGLDVIGWSVHPPLAGDDDTHRAEIERLLTGLDPGLEVWVSHLSADAAARLPDTHRYRLRLGTALWHGDKSMLHLSADVLDVRHVAPDVTRAGYRLVEVPGRGSIVMIGAGSAHGVTALPDGRSPFHHARRRLDLLEPPHMHTSMAFVPDGAPVPAIGERVDVQRPLTMTAVDEVEWSAT